MDELLQAHYPPYFYWLCELVCVDGRYSDESYYILAKLLYQTAFRWTHPIDENRADWGENLRDIWTVEEGIRSPDLEIEGRVCSVLEMLIALAQSMAKTMDELDDEDQTTRWFWEMIENLGLADYSDQRFYEHPKFSNQWLGVIEHRLDRWMDRDISFDGHGGLFPLKEARENQRDVDIWYQAQAYMLERYR